MLVGWLLVCWLCPSRTTKPKQCCDEWICQTAVRLMGISYGVSGTAVRFCSSGHPKLWSPFKVEQSHQKEPTGQDICICLCVRPVCLTRPLGLLVWRHLWAVEQRSKLLWLSISWIRMGPIQHSSHPGHYLVIFVLRRQNLPCKMSPIFMAAWSGLGSDKFEWRVLERYI